MGLLDFLYPKKCINCGKFGEYLCTDCFSKIRYNDYFICPTCGKHSSTFWKHFDCQKVQKQNDLDGILTITVYNNISKKLINRLKNPPNLTPLAVIISDIMIEHLIQNEVFYEFLLKENPVVIPIPISQKKYKERGYNQSSLLAFYVAQYFKLKMLDGVLICVKDIKPQNKLTTLQRTENIKNSYEINKKFKSQKTVILIDDTARSLSTLKEAARILKINGSKTVIGLTFVREI